VTERFAGVIEIDCSTGVGAATVSTVVPLTERRTAPILADPSFRAEAKPLEVTEATVAAEDVQVTS